MAVIETTTTTTAVTSVGLAALLTGAVGAVAADVMMVVLASIAGVVISLSAAQSVSPWKALSFFGGAALTSLTLAWALAALLGNLHPSMNSAYTPTIIAFVIGTQSHRLNEIAAKITGRFEKKIEGETK
jgi:hypothetical protein